MGACCCRVHDVTSIQPTSHIKPQPDIISSSHKLHLPSPSSPSSRPPPPSRAPPPRPRPSHDHDKPSHEDIPPDTGPIEKSCTPASYDHKTHHRHPHSNLNGDLSDIHIEMTSDTSGADLSPEETQRAMDLARTSRTSVLSKTRVSHRAAFDYMCIIGSGSFGHVLRVRHKKTLRTFAMKLMDVRTMNHLLQTEKIGLTKEERAKAKAKGHKYTRHQWKRTSMSEDKIMQTLDHVFIVRLEETFQTAAHIFLVMELVEGQTLATLMEHVTRKGQLLELERVRKWSAEILLALMYIHELNIVHRDLKPDNIMITPADHVKLMDFGVAFTVNSQKTSSARMIGARGFKAPEMLTGKEYDFSIDWWNFGILLYIMLCGCHPFFRSGFFARDEDSNALRKPVEFPSHIDPDAKDLISRLLIKDAHKRLGCGQKGTSYPYAVQAHAFFASVDFAHLMSEGEKHRFSSMLKYSPDEKPQFRDVSHVISTVKAADPATQLEKLGLYEI